LAKRYIDSEFWVDINRTRDAYDSGKIDLDKMMTQYFGYLEMAEKDAINSGKKDDWDKIKGIRKSAGINKYLCRGCGNVVDAPALNQRICPYCGADNKMG